MAGKGTLLKIEVLDDIGYLHQSSSCFCFFSLLQKRITAISKGCLHLFLQHWQKNLDSPLQCFRQYYDILFWLGWVHAQTSDPPLPSPFLFYLLVMVLFDLLAYCPSNCYCCNRCKSYKEENRILHEGRETVLIAGKKTPTQTDFDHCRPSSILLLHAI